MTNEQLEVRISGRDFGISLKGYNPQANREIRAQLAGETDLLALLRAYLDVVHQKCELESKIAQLHEKLESIPALESKPESMRVLAITDSTESSSSQTPSANSMDSALDSRAHDLLDSAATNPATLDSIDSATLESNVSASVPVHDLFSAFDTALESTKQESPAL